jgi:hypothetical protein
MPHQPISQRNPPPLLNPRQSLRSLQKKSPLSLLLQQQTPSQQTHPPQKPSRLPKANSPQLLRLMPRSRNRQEPQLCY